MKFLFAMFQGGGNVPLITPIAARLVDRGHSVRVLAGPGIRPNRLPVSEVFLRRIAETGAALVPFKEPAVHPFDKEPSLRGLVMGWTPAALGRESRETRNALWSSSWAANVAVDIRRSLPDAVARTFSC